MVLPSTGPTTNHTDLPGKTCSLLPQWGDYYGVSSCFLVEFVEVCSIGGNGWHCKPHQKPMAGEIISPRVEPIVVIFAAFSSQFDFLILRLIPIDLGCSQLESEKILFVVDSS